MEIEHKVCPIGHKYTAGTVKPCQGLAQRRGNEYRLNLGFAMHPALQKKMAHELRHQNL